MKITNTFSAKAMKIDPNLGALLDENEKIEIEKISNSETQKTIIRRLKGVISYYNSNIDWITMEEIRDTYYILKYIPITLRNIESLASKFCGQLEIDIKLNVLIYRIVYPGSYDFYEFRTSYSAHKSFNNREIEEDIDNKWIVGLLIYFLEEMNKWEKGEVEI